MNYLLSAKRRVSTLLHIPRLETIVSSEVIDHMTITKSHAAVVGKPKLTDHPIVIDIASRLNADPAQVLVAWGAYRGYSVIPKSVQERE